jgi:N utilization substance protein A
MQNGYDSLVALPGMSISMADTLYEKGYFSAEELSNAAPEDLIQIRDIDTTEKAEKLIEIARDYVANIKEVEATSEEALSDDLHEPTDQNGSETLSLPDDQKDSSEEAGNEENVSKQD